jgi:hypothetical protein
MLMTLALAACGGEAPAPRGSGQVRLCDAEPRADVYVDGLERPAGGGGFVARLLSVEVEGAPRPPDRGVNVWRLALRDAAGAPLEGAAVRVRTWMPDHGHGTAPNDLVATPDGAPGEYRLGPFDLFMSGLWEFTVRAPVGGAVDEARFAFCLEG